jgi:hypothetical protein
MISQSIHDVKEIKIEELKGRTDRSGDNYVVRQITITTDKDIDINITLFSHDLNALNITDSEFNIVHKD